MVEKSGPRYVAFKDFDPEDIEIKVDGGKMILTGRREVKRGNSSSVRSIGKQQ